MNEAVNNEDDNNEAGAKPGSDAAPNAIEPVCVDFEALHPQARWGLRLTAWSMALAPIAVITVATSLLLAEGLGQDPKPIVLGLVPVLLLLGGWAGWVYAEARFRSTRLRLDDTGIELQRGVWWCSETRIARARVQHTDINRGPLDRRLGIATLVIHTAGTDMAALRIAGLAEARAVALRDALVQDHDDAL